jgi:capsular polysaccharide biosynthesis protein
MLVDRAVLVYARSLSRRKAAGVDFWDLSKLLVRRWWVAVPMVALTFALMGLTYTTVKPNYNVTAYVVLVAPVGTPDKQGELTQAQRNPWLFQGLLALANAASTSVLDPAVPEEMQNAGFSPSFTVAMTATSAVITFTVTGNSAEQATGTATELVRRYAESVKALQDQTRVAPADQITASRLGSAVGAVESNGNVKRALAAMGGAGLLMTAGATIGVDALLRRRSRRRLEQDDLLDVAPMPMSAPVSPSEPAPARPAPAGPTVSRSSVLQPVSPAPVRDRVDVDAKVPPSRVTVNGGGPADSKDAGRPAEVTAALVAPVTASVEPDAGERLTRAPDREPDTTIVLPLTFGSSRNGDGRRS